MGYSTWKVRGKAATTVQANGCEVDLVLPLQPVCSHSSRALLPKRGQIKGQLHGKTPQTTPQLGFDDSVCLNAFGVIIRQPLFFA